MHFHEDISAWEEEFFEALEFLKQFNIVNGEYFINEKLQAGKKSVGRRCTGQYAGC